MQYRNSIARFFALLVTAILAFASHAATVSGPIMGGKQGKAFNTPDLDLKKYGYTVEEFFVDGDAHAFELKPGTQQTSDGRWSVQRKPDAVAYRTRILVVRPIDAKKFNGTVIVHWQNVTAGYELGVVTEGEYLRGYAWVGVSAQKVGIDGFPGPDAAGLKQWDPARYSSLNHPGDDYSYDIYGQAGALVGTKRSGKIDPLGKLPVKRVIAAGASQSAGRLRAYINGIHPLDHVFDAYIPYIDFARATPFSAAPVTTPPSPTALNSAAPILNRGSTIIRTDLDVPVFVVNSETESEGYVVARQPNTDKFRFWEVSGTSHVTVPRAIANNPNAELRAGLKIGDLSTPNWLSYRPVYDAVIRHTQEWLVNKKVPPEAPLIEMATTNPAKIARDDKGNALGGIRLPEFAAAAAEHRGNGTTKPGGYRLGFLYGFARDFSDEQLHQLYPNAAVYLAVYDKALADDIAKGYLLKEDGPGMRKIAAEWAKKLER